MTDPEIEALLEGLAAWLWIHPYNLCVFTDFWDDELCPSDFLPARAEL